MFTTSLGLRANTVPFCSKLSPVCLLIAIACFFSVATAQKATAQAYNGGRSARALVVESINEGKLVTLAGNIHPAATAENDRGAVSDNLPMDHMQLQLQRPPELEQELVNLIDEQQRKGSPQYHKWLTAKQFGDRFGVSQQDIETVSNWLQNHGFRVDGVPTSGMFIEFSGTAGQVKRAFHTEIHNVEVDGESHIANMSDPQIPAALTGVVKGVHALHNFMPHAMVKKRSQFTFDCPTPTCLSDTTLYAVGPQDLATIYNLNPAFNAGINGAGQTVVVIEDTNILNAGDVSTFRSAFGLSGYKGTFSQVNPPGSTTCTNPGVNGDESEAALDAEWAGASAPDANVVLASCADTGLVFGGLIALQNLVNSANPPAIVSISYGECELENGNAANAAYVTTYQQAAALGTSVFVSSGDEGAASCDADKTVATHGIAVSGFTSTPYNVSVGGTDFGDVYLNAAESGPALSTYWGGDGSNTSALGSALSYIPEIPWNDSCASQLIYTLPILTGGSYTQSYGTSGFCNSTIGKADFRTTGSGSGGPSNYEVTHKPFWQSVFGNPNDNTRDIPDISLFAANGVFNHFFVYCLTDAGQGGVPCDYTNVTDTLALAAGGTSFSSPIMAGVQALINQYDGGLAQGNPDFQLYALANGEYGTSGNAACNSSLGTGVASSCIFYDVTIGDIDVNCRGTSTSSENCFGYTGTSSTAVQGALSTTTTSLSIAYGTNSGWDFATGLGSVNVYNLIKDWNGIPTTTVVTSSGSPSVSGGSVTFTATVTPSLGSENTVTGVVQWQPNIGCVEPVEISAGTATCTTSSLALGSTTVTATYVPANTSFAGSSGSFTQTVNAALAITSAAGASFTAGTAGSFLVTTTGSPTPALGETGALPAGVTFTDNGNGTATISGTPATGTGAAYLLTISANNGGTIATQSFTLTIDQAPAITSANNTTFPAGTAGTFSVTTTGFPTSALNESGALPSGVTFTDNGNGTGTLAGTTASSGSFPISITANNGVSPSAVQSFALTVTQASQTITFPALPSLTYGETGVTLSATASSGLTVSFATTTPSICTVSGTTLTLVGALNNCTIQATQAGDSDYLAAPAVSRSSYVNRGTQSITFATPPTQTYGGVLSLSATASSGLAVSFASTTTSICTVSGTSATMVSGGTCTIQASQAGNSDYLAAGTVSRSFKVAQAAQTITFPALPALTYGETGVMLSATASSGLAVSFASTTPSICTVSGTTLTIVGAQNNCTIQATQAGNVDYLAATAVSHMSYVKRATQSITFAMIPTQPYGEVLALSATASSGLAVGYASTTTSICTVSGTTATMIALGNCTIQASQAGNSDYLAAGTVSRSFKVTQAAQTINFPALPTLTYGETGITLSATASSGLAVTFASTTPTICTVSGTTLTIVKGQSNCTIQATQAGNTNYLAAPAVSQSSYVNRKGQSITFTTIPTTALSAGTVSLSATASSGLAVSFASTTTSVCTVSDTTATLVSAGTCTIQATQAGNSNYLAAGTATRSFTVTAN